MNIVLNAKVTFNDVPTTATKKQLNIHQSFNAWL